MKPNCEHADHAAIHWAKDSLINEARMLLNWDLKGRISSQMQQLAKGGNVSWDLLIRLLSEELTGSEKREIQKIAGLRKPTTPPKEFFFPKKK
jgi:hypothetical protein